MEEFSRNKSRLRRKKRIKAKLSGSSKRPRLSPFRSLRGMYLQVIDDSKGATLASVSLHNLSGKNNKNDIESASKLGTMIAKKCAELKIDKVVYDRGGYKYHGKIKAIAEAARKEGLKL